MVKGFWAIRKMGWQFVKILGVNVPRPTCATSSTAFPNGFFSQALIKRWKISEPRFPGNLLERPWQVETQTLATQIWSSKLRETVPHVIMEMWQTLCQFVASCVAICSYNHPLSWKLLRTFFKICTAIALKPNKRTVKCICHRVKRNKINLYQFVVCVLV